MKSFWNERYGVPEYAYGEAPNEFMKERLKLLPKGSILFPAEGEGRNAVFAAEQGWQVSAFDMSEAGKQKADALAAKKGVSVDYAVSTLEEADYPPSSFDALVLIFVHFPPNKRQEYHRRLAAFLKPGGTLILEGFSKEHIEFSRKNPKVGGPQNVEMLFSIEELTDDFVDFDFVECCQTTVNLNEGLYHVGDSNVIRLVGIKR